MEKVVVPQCVADWYDSAFEKSSRLSRILSSFADEVIKDDQLFSWAKTYAYTGKHDNETSNVEEIIAKMYIYGFDVENEVEKKYYWRKKKDHYLSVEYDEYPSYIHLALKEKITFFSNSKTGVQGYKAKFTEAEMRELVNEDDFSKLEKVD